MIAWLKRLFRPMNKVLASTFADPKDVAAYRAAKARGLSDSDAFRVGDNGVGCWGDVTAQTFTPMVALPPEEMIRKFGRVNLAKHAKVLVEYRGLEVEAIVADRMPWAEHRKNGCELDMNPALCQCLGIPFPSVTEVRWCWV